MPTITVNVAARGTPLAGGGSSSVGHMWIEINSGSGPSESYGFAPGEQHHGTALAPGEVYRNDSVNYLDRAYSQTIVVSQAEYDAIKGFVDNPTSAGFDLYYNGTANSCIDFAWRALEAAGLNPQGYQGSLWPTNNIEDLKKYLELS